GNLMHHIARCCQPIPGDEIVGFITQHAPQHLQVVGFITQGRGISVHHADHQRISGGVALTPYRVNNAFWR
ncbi:hypothetical protein ACUODF_58700, partial [Escherichia coli]